MVFFGFFSSFGSAASRRRFERCRSVENMLAQLPASEFCTPGRRAFGDLGLIDTERDKYAGLQIAEFAITEWSEPSRLEMCIITFCYVSKGSMVLVSTLEVCEGAWCIRVRV